MLYPIGIQNFKDLREKGFVYVDKTALVHRLAAQGKYYFLSRPRRFGKSLLISTMEAYFSGKKELFKGLAMETLEKDWANYPILHLDLNTEKYDSPESLERVLDLHLRQWEEIYGADPIDTSVALRFLGLVKRAYEKTGKQAVILIDEYDKPLLQAIGNEELQNEFRNTLKAFYSVLKTQDRYIRFAFLTGVTKFGKVSVFSDLNNLNDISMDAAYADICGITEAELLKYFDSSIHELAEATGKTFEETCRTLKEQYDGYHFRQNSVGIYNPFSVLNTFSKNEFSDYWFETGTPTFLVELLKNADYNLNDLQTTSIPAKDLNSVGSMKQSPISIIYQSGYLTIKSYNARFNQYDLDFPNREVETGFLQSLLPAFTPVEETKTGFFITQFIADVEDGNPEGFLERLQTMLDDSDYRIAGKMEKYFQNAMYLVFKMMGFYTEVERSTSRGRIDVVLKTKDYIYVMELKLDGSPEEALQQIEDKGYATPFAQDPRKLFKIGVNFSSETRGIESWKITANS